MAATQKKKKTATVAASYIHVTVQHKRKCASNENILIWAECGRRVGNADAKLTWFACVKCKAARWKMKLPKSVTFLRPTCTRRDRADGWLQSSERVAASGKGSRTVISFKYQADSIRRIHLITLQAERCYLISAYSCVIYYSMLLEIRCEQKQLLQHQKKNKKEKGGGKKVD